MHMKTLIILTYLAFARAACREYGLWTPTSGQWFFDLCPYNLCDYEGFEKYNPGCDPNHIYAGTTYTIPYRSAKLPATWALEDTCTPVLQLNRETATTPAWTTRIVLSSGSASTTSIMPDDVAVAMESSDSSVSTARLAGTKTFTVTLAQQDGDDGSTTTASNSATDSETTTETSAASNSVTSTDSIASTKSELTATDTTATDTTATDTTATDTTATYTLEASTSQTSTLSSTSHITTTISSILLETTSTTISTFTSLITSTLTSITLTTSQGKETVRTTASSTESSSRTSSEPARPTASCYAPSDDYITIGDRQAEYAAMFCEEFASQVHRLRRNLHWDKTYGTGDEGGYYFEIGVDNSCEDPLGEFSLAVDICTSIMHGNWEDCKSNKGQGRRYTMENCLVLNYKPTRRPASTTTLASTATA